MGGNMAFEELDYLLRQRRTEEASSDLCERIVVAAARREQRGGASRRSSSGFFAELSAMLAVPKPVFAMAVFLLIGFSAGFFADGFGVLPDLTPEDLAGFMVIEDRFVAGEWL